MKKIILLILCLFFLTSCYDYQELNDMSIVNGIGVDFQDDQYIIYLEINNSVKKNGDSELVTEIIEGRDENIALAYTKATEGSNKMLYAEHVNLLLLSQTVAEKGIDEIIDFLLRDLNINNNYMAIVTENPYEILQIKKPNNSIVNLIVDTIQYDIQTTYKNDIDFVAAKLLNSRISLALPYVHIENDTILVDQIACFQKDKLVHVEDAKIYNFLMHDSSYITFKKENTVINVYKKKIAYDISKDKIVIRITGDGNIKAVEENYNLKDIHDYEEIEKIMNKEIEEEISAFLDKTTEQGLDLLGFKDKYYKKYKENKNAIPYEVTAAITLNKNGNIYEVIYD